jgi:hypothetical protein
MRGSKNDTIETIESLFHIYISILVISIFFLGVPFAFACILIFFTTIISIAGIILFVSLCRARQLAVTPWKIFFLLPHILLCIIPIIRNIYDTDFSFVLTLLKKTKSSFEIMVGVCFLIVTFGLPFLLYCFLQVADKKLSIIAKILCFILPILSFGAFGFING